MINRTSIFSQKLPLVKSKILANPKENQNKEETPKQNSQVPKVIEANANELIGLQNSAFISINKNNPPVLEQEETKPKENTTQENKTKSQKEPQTEQPKTNLSSENNFFITKRTLELDDLIPTPQTLETEQAPIPSPKPAPSTRSSSSGGVVLNGGTKLADEFTSVMAQIDLSTMPSEMANGIQEFANLIKNQEQYNTVLNTYADYWMQENNVAEITTGNVKEFMTSFFGEEFGINVANLGKMVGGAALLSIASQIVVSSAAERFPEMAKDVVNLGKDFYGNLFKGQIGKSLKALGKIPKLLGEWTVKGVKSLATNAYKVVGGVVKPIVTGIADAAKTSITGSINTVKTFVNGSVSTIKTIAGGVVDGGKKVVNGFVNAGRKLLNGNILGAAGSVIGGVAKGAVSIVKGVAKGAVSAVKTVGKTIGKAVSTVGKTVGKVGKAIGKGVKKIFKGW